MASDKAGRYTGDPALCREMAQILDVELNGGSMQTDSLEIRKYLATALRIFTVDDGVPTLISAAKTRRELTELPVQAEAFDSLGVLTHRFCPVGTNTARDSWKYYPEVRDLTLALADDTEPEIRERAAFHLAEFPEPAATEKLKKLLDDGRLETRFNACTSLAMRGDVAALPILEEMLRIQQDDLLPKIPAGEEPTAKQTAEAKQRRLIILNNAGDAVVKFHKANPATDLAPIVAAMEKLREEKNPELTQFIDGKLAQLNSAK
ncbi:MAG: HEAT repeat domain-containing protein [Pirellulales bacterium]